MNCKDCQNYFSEYFDHALDTQTVSEVVSHLSSCQMCSNEWLAFKNTVGFLHNIPQEKVPPGFLTGIHHKLESKSSLSKLLDWFSTTSVRVAASGAFAVLFVGIITAVVVQNIPLEKTVKTENRVALSDQKQTGGDINTPIQMAANTVSSTSQSSKEFYPGVPMLSEYEDTGGIVFSPYAFVASRQEKNTSPQVNFVSTGIQRPQSSTREMFPFSFSKTTSSRVQVNPDVYLTLHPGSPADLSDLMHHIIHSSSWQIAAYSDKSLTLAVPSANLDELNHLCAQLKASVSPPYLLSSRSGSPQKRVLVAIQWN
jgi:hypothetical protein